LFLILFIISKRLGSLWTVMQVSALQVKDFWRYLTKNLVVWTSGRLTHKLKKLSPKAIFKVLNSVTFFSYNTSFWSIRGIQYYRRKHDDLIGSEQNIFWSKNVFFLNIFRKKQKIEHFWLTKKAITFEQLNKF
jgi:hypothetical protein